MDETIYVILKLLFDFALEVWFSIVKKIGLTLALLNPDLSIFENSVDPDQLTSDEAI